MPAAAPTHSFDALGLVPQAKLRVSQVGDPMEQEADAVAEHIMATGGANAVSVSAEGSAWPTAGLNISRRRDPGRAGDDARISAAEPLVQSTIDSRGEPLPSETRSFMEAGFGHDFGHVRVHADAAAARSANALEANAYTVGNHIAFAPGAYAPGTREGERLIAHELTHVVQQDAALPHAESGSQATDGMPMTAARQAVDGSMLVQRDAAGQTAPAPRLPTPSLASAIPAKVKGIQSQFHERMREATDIIEGTKFHYDYVNGIYAENYKIHRVVVGQAAEEELQNERIRDAIISAAALAAKMSPEGEAASLVVQIWQIAKKVEGVSSKVGKAITIAKAIAPGDKKAGGDGDANAPAKPHELQLIGLENVVSLAMAVAQARDAGDSVLDAAVDLATQVAADTPDSGQLSAETGDALNEAATACEALLAETDRMMASLRTLRARRAVPIPSWHEVEQDIWLAYFNSIGHVPPQQVLQKHMVDIGLWGPPGQPGGRLGVADEIEGIMAYEGSKTIPGHEDEDKKQSVAPQTVSKSQLIQSAAATLPAKWRKIMLLSD